MYRNLRFRIRRCARGPPATVAVAAEAPETEPTGPQLSATARIIHGDLLKQDYASADLITVYLLPVASDKLIPILEKQLKKGARIVSHNSPFPPWIPEKIEDIENDGEGASHRLYLYRR